MERAKISGTEIHRSWRRVYEEDEVETCKREIARKIGWKGARGGVGREGRAGERGRGTSTIRTTPRWFASGSVSASHRRRFSAARVTRLGQPRADNRVAAGCRREINERTCVPREEDRRGHRCD